MKKVLWTENAVQNLLKIQEYIYHDSPEQAKIWSETLFQAGESLTQLSERGRIVPEFNQKNLRELIIENYRVVYRVLPSSVEILTVFEGHRLLKKQLLTSK